MKNFFLSILVSYCLLASAAVFSSVSWQGVGYNHFSKDEALDSLLTDFSSAVGIPITLSNRLKANTALKVNGNFKNLSAIQFLNQLSGLYQLTWYFDGNALYVYRKDEMKSELLRFDDTEISAVKKMLVNLKIWDRRFGWKALSDRNLLFVSGPPRYIELIKEVAGLVDKKNSAGKNKVDYEVRVFQLKYASAQDRTVSHQGTVVLVPGMATTIKNILGGGSQLKNKKEKEQKNEEKPSSVFGVLQNEIAEKQNNSDLTEELKRSDFVSESNKKEEKTQLASYIEANPQQNAVVVYDIGSRMPLYEQLISALDVPLEQIQIEVSIIDVSTNHLDELGLDLSSKSKNSQFGIGNTKTITDGLTSGFSAAIGNNVASASVLGSTNYLVSRLRFLENSGDGQVLSQPSVITLNNAEAIIDNSTTFYVKLQGEREVKLVPVNAGSILKVTPRIIRDNGKQMISLNVNIEDGRVLSDQQNQVDNLPQVSNSTITTQAVVDENNSLLIGGYYRDVAKKDFTRVPLLGSIPFFGALVNSDSKSRSKVARLFMITPHIVKNSTAETAANKIYEDLVTSKGFDSQQLKYQPPQYNIFENKKKLSKKLEIYE